MIHSQEKSSVKTSNNEVSKRWMTRQEAANFLGVQPQTISNYAAKGILHEDRRGRSLRYPRKEVETLSRLPELYAVEEMQAKLQSEYANVKQLYDERRALFLEQFKDASKWDKYKYIVRQLTEMAAGHTMSEHQRDVFLSVLDLQSFQEIADRYGVSRERIRQLFENAIRRILEFRDIATVRLKESQRKVLELTREIEHLHEVIISLQSRRETEFPDPVDTSSKFTMLRPFTTRIEDVYLSARTYNCLHSAGIKTLGDMVAYGETEYWKIRNLGRKSIYEIRETLEKLGLQFKMWENTEYPRLSDLRKRPTTD